LAVAQEEDLFAGVEGGLVRRRGHDGAVGVVLEERPLEPRVEGGVGDRDEDEPGEGVLPQRLEERDVLRRAELLLEDPRVGILRREEQVDHEPRAAGGREEHRRTNSFPGGDERGGNRGDREAEPVLPVLVNEAPLAESGEPDHRDGERREGKYREKALRKGGRLVPFPPATKALRAEKDEEKQRHPRDGRGEVRLEVSALARPPGRQGNRRGPDRE